jgi:signal transduction histidine kinase
MSEGSIRGVIDQAVRSSTPVAEQYDVMIVSHVEEGIPPILMDEGRLPQAFVNLLENAIHHSPPGGAVLIEANPVFKEGKCWAECLIIDSGSGFRPEDLPKVFDPFFSRRKGGTGLGLSIVQRIVESHGGKICAANRQPGPGAVIRVLLPAATDHP